VCGCPIPGVRVSKSGCVGVRFRVYGCPIPGVCVSDPGCVGVRFRVCVCVSKGKGRKQHSVVCQEIISQIHRHSPSWPNGGAVSPSCPRVVFFFFFFNQTAYRKKANVLISRWQYEHPVNDNRSRENVTLKSCLR
jgi:hypothetical protein